MSSCTVTNCNPAFFFFQWFWSRGVFLAEQPFRSCHYMTHFPVNLDTFVPVSSSIFKRLFAAVFGLILIFSTKSTFISRRQNMSPSLTVKWLCGSMVFKLGILSFAQMNMGPSCIWKLLPRIYLTCRGPILILISWLISFDYPMVSSKMALKAGLKHCHV